MDLTVWPSNFVPHQVDTTVRCGSVEYSRPTVQQMDDVTSMIHLSEGLTIRARRLNGRLSTTINLTLEGSLRDQLQDLDFFLAAGKGEPLEINGAPNASEEHSFPDEKAVILLRGRIGRIVELFGAIGADESLVGSVSWSEVDKRKLLTLHRAIVLDEDVPATSDGYGRWDIDVGPFTIATVVSEGSTPERRRFADAFDPSKRSGFQLWHTNDEGSIEKFANGTVYESLKVHQLRNVLNLHLEEIAKAYENLEDRPVACTAANQMVLSLLSAADLLEGARRERLLGGAETLSDWLVANGEDKLVYNINWWQTRRRLGTLSVEDEANIRTQRRATLRVDDVDDVDARLREACLSILLRDFDELELIVKDLPKDQTEKLRSWPIWALAADR
jgi:hypothetical protein